MSANRKIKMKKWNPPNHEHHFSHLNQSGFSLVELVFAMMFLTIIILGVVNLQTSSLGMLNGQKNQVQAHFLATQGAQIVKALGIGVLPICAVECARKIEFDNGTQEYKLLGPPDSRESQLIGNQTFYRSIRILTEPEGMDNSTKIRTIVEWEDSTGNHSFSENSHVETSLIVF